MRKLLSFMFVMILFTLFGCVTNPKYGNFANTSMIFNQKVANDTVKELVVFYPPATTKFNIQHPITDSFGMLLVRMLRQRGYAIYEYKPNQRHQYGTHGLKFNYIIDAINNSNLKRVTINIGNQSLSRLYRAQNGAVYIESPWIRKE